MVPVGLAMLGSGARRPTVAFLGWFGPRGLASIVFAVILVEEAELANESLSTNTIFLTIALSSPPARHDGNAPSWALRSVVRSSTRAMPRPPSKVRRPPSTVRTGGPAGFGESKPPTS